LKQRIIREIDAGWHVLGHERNLLRLREEVIRHPVKHQPTDRHGRQNLLGDDLSGIEHVEIEIVRERLIKELELQFPFRKIASLDRRPEIAAMKIGICAVDLDRFVPQHRLQAQFRLPVKLDERRFALRIDEPEGVDAEAFDKAKRSRNRPIRHDPHDHVHALRGQTDKIPEIVVSCLGLGKAQSGSSLAA
jgi:hypothetical protein